MRITQIPELELKSASVWNIHNLLESVPLLHSSSGILFHRDPVLLYVGLSELCTEERTKSCSSFSHTHLCSTHVWNLMWGLTFKKTLSLKTTYSGNRPWGAQKLVRCQSSPGTWSRRKRKQNVFLLRTLQFFPSLQIRTSTAIGGGRYQLLTVEDPQWRLWDLRLDQNQEPHLNP